MSPEELPSVHAVHFFRQCYLDIVVARVCLDTLHKGILLPLWKQHKSHCEATALWKSMRKMILWIGNRTAHSVTDGKGKSPHLIEPFQLNPRGHSHPFCIHSISQMLTFNFWLRNKNSEVINNFPGECWCMLELHIESCIPDFSEVHWIVYEWLQSFDFSDHMVDTLELFLKIWELIYCQPLISQEQSIIKGVTLRSHWNLIYYHIFSFSLNDILWVFWEFKCNNRSYFLGMHIGFYITVNPVIQLNPSFHTDKGKGR